MNDLLSRFYLTFFTVVIAVCCASFIIHDDIILVDEPFPFKPHGFYISNVTNGLPEKENIAIVAVRDKNARPVLKEAGLQGGTALAVSRFVARNLEKDVNALPVSMAIKNIKLTESILPNGSIDGKVTLSLSFSQTKNYGTMELLNYSGGVHYIRSVNNDKVIEAQLRNAIKAGLMYFNNWMQINLPVNPRLAKSVKFNFTNYADKIEGDTIYYSTARPLTWKDFQSKIRPDGPFEATVMPGFGYDLKEDVKDGVINVSIALKTYVAKTDCWVGGTRNAYALNHEQRHFDIARIITSYYQQKIINADLTPDTYQAFINMQYLDSYREMNAMQRAYDKETRHGLDVYTQTEWNKKIDKLLTE
ncbi:DUF922 domain-containing protein [Mucilaginibacter auburnensis]|uniref:DUF922 domain-containing protein n=1 Tax=Mucilaginibacter auburnensis TaxID=1457233 RepID=A0A2H9VSZ2_9SPHI|nr:hypothetical protein [Mucilaginibacter auburnensis]PJJ83933.1 hypothetical protein CLV57_0929 [Mucilaginibacter auburnensis]